jgi:hypothetical protein
MVRLVPSFAAALLNGHLSILSNEILLAPYAQTLDSLWSEAFG